MIKNTKKIKERFQMSNGFKPIWSYCYFLFKFLIKKKTTFILPILSFFMVLIISLVPYIIYSSLSNDEKNNPLFSFAYASDKILISSSIIATLFSITFLISKSINIFKDCENEGVELIIVSKPIERWQILITKFSFVFILSVLISLFNLLAFLPGSILTNNIYNHIGVYKNTKIILLSLVGSCFIGSLIFSSICIMISLSWSRKLSMSLTTSLCYWTITIGALCSTFVSPDPVISLDNNRSKYLDPTSYYSTNSNLIYTFTSNSVLTDSEFEKDIKKANHNNDWFSALSWLNVGQFIYDINSKNYASNSNDLYINPFEKQTLSENYSPTNIIKKTNNKFLKVSDNTNINNDYQISSTNNYYVPLNIFDKESYIASNHEYDVANVNSKQTLFNIKEKNSINTVQSKIYIPNYFEYSNKNEISNLTQTFNSYLTKVINNKNISYDFFNFLSIANNKLKQNNGTTNDFDFNNIFNDFVNKYEFKNIISSDMVIPLIEEKNMEQTTYYTDVKKLLVAVSILNLLSLNGSSYLELCNHLLKKDSISFDLKFYESKNLNQQKTFTLTTQFSTSNKSTSDGTTTTTSAYGLNIKSSNNYYSLEVVGNTSPVYGVTIFWFLIGIILFSISVIIYNRRDFK